MRKGLLDTLPAHKGLTVRAQNVVCTLLVLRSWDKAALLITKKLQMESANGDECPRDSALRFQRRYASRTHARCSVAKEVSGVLIPTWQQVKMSKPKGAPRKARLVNRMTTVQKKKMLLVNALGHYYASSRICKYLVISTVQLVQYDFQI